MCKFQTRSISGSKFKHLLVLSSTIITCRNRFVLSDSEDLSPAGRKYRFHFSETEDHQGTSFVFLHVIERENNASRGKNLSALRFLGTDRHQGCKNKSANLAKFKQLALWCRKRKKWLVTHPFMTIEYYWTHLSHIQLILTLKCFDTRMLRIINEKCESSWHIVLAYNI